MTRKNFAALIGLSLVMACGAAHAQLYHYKDAQGRMVYSDTPPPAGVPAANVLKAPKLRQGSPGPDAPAATADAKDGKDGKDPKDGKAKKGPQTTAEREADYKKRMAEADKKGKEDAQKADQTQQNQARCTALQANLAALQSGQRMRKIDASGNPYFVEDTERSADVAKAQQDMAASKCN
ncbi:MAG: hypothetical protein JWN73_3207 [Betaproteobacteria bacterium]|nr:hypothetical protein [Betaproteobacteria bacterium]